MASPELKHIGKILPAAMTRQIYSLQVEYVDDGNLLFVLFFVTVFGRTIIRTNHISNNSYDNISSLMI